MAGVVHGHIRTTQDMNLWVKADNETIGLEDLITEKQATGRPKDLIDVDELTKLKK